MGRKWIKNAIKRPGDFSAKARAAGMSTDEYADAIADEEKNVDARTKRQAVLARTLRSFRNARKPRGKSKRRSSK